MANTPRKDELGQLAARLVALGAIPIAVFCGALARARAALGVSQTAQAWTWMLALGAAVGSVFVIARRTARVLDGEVQVCGSKPRRSVEISDVIVILPVKGNHMTTILRTVAHDIRGRLVCVLILASAVSLTAQVSKEEMLKSLKIDKLRHPYLFFTKDEIPAIQKRSQTDQETRDIMAGVMMKAHRWLYFQVKDPPPEFPRHPRYAADSRGYFTYCSELTEGAITLAFVYQMTGDMAYAKKGIAWQ